METLIVIDIMGHRSSKGELKGFNNSTAPPTNSTNPRFKQEKFITILVLKKLWKLWLNGSRFIFNGRPNLQTFNNRQREREGVLEYTMYRMEVLSVEMSHFELWVCTKRHFNCNTSLTNIDHENFIADVSGVNRTAARINLLRTNGMQR